MITISGQEVFKLYDTYGFPFELTLEYLEEQNFTTSKEEFDSYMEEQKKQAKANRKQETTMNSQNEDLLKFTENSEFIYNSYTEHANIIGLFNDNGKVNEINKEGYIILDKTCFYAECGGQVGDTGMITSDSFKARVLDCIKAPNGQNLHKVKVLDGIIKLNDNVKCNVDTLRRKKIEVNHSTVHLLQYALRNIISEKIHQAGSRVDDMSLRFDFTYTGKILDEEIIEVENFLNEYIKKNIECTTEVMSIEEAKKTGAMALFTEKYGNEVRVVTIGDSKELCGGTHIKNTNEIEKIAIVYIESKGSNVYRIEAVTNDLIEGTLMETIKPYNDEKIKLLMKARNIISKAKSEGIELDFFINIDNKDPLSYKDIINERNELEFTQEEVKNLEKTYKEKRQSTALSDLSEYDNNIEEINGIKTVIMKVENKDTTILKGIVDTLLNKLETGFIFIANIKEDNSINFIARSNINTKAGDIIKLACSMSNGNGGGSPTFAQGGGKDISKLEEIFACIKEQIN